MAASRLGAVTAFIGGVGRDSFGAFLKNCLKDNSADVNLTAEDIPAMPTLEEVLC